MAWSDEARIEEQRLGTESRLRADLPGDGGGGLPGQRATMRASFGFRRGWNFRSATGFTALGVSKVEPSTASQTTTSPPPMNGVLFQVPSHMMAGFDRREVGYDKVQIPLEYIELCNSDDYPDTASSSKQSNSDHSEEEERLHVPQQQQPGESSGAPLPRSPIPTPKSKDGQVSSCSKLIRQMR